MINFDKNFILNWLKENDLSKLNELWQLADKTRKNNVGNAVHLRGLIEVSNHCVRKCNYCGLNAERKDLTRYRMTAEEIFDCAKQAVEFGYGTVVLQAGEDYGITQNWLSEIVRQIKEQTPLAVTLSMGERPVDDIAAWRNAGADRYLLRFETSDDELYDKIHPPLPKDQMSRIDLLKKIKTLGYEAGSGIMIGIPGQSFESVAEDILLFKELNLDMIGVGPYIAHQDTLLSRQEKLKTQQVPSDEIMVYKVVALTRLACPQANIPSTTALATLNKNSGRENGLNRGANVVMPNLTPIQYRKYYEIYPAKVCINETSNDCRFCIQGRILSIGREAGTGQGSRTKSTSI